MRLSDGTTLQGGEYRIERFLGQGGFGITYLAYEPGLKRQVVIKEFFIKDFCNRDSATSQVTVLSEGGRQTVEHFHAKFIREAQTIAGLEHPHIIPIYRVFEENGTAYYVMKYLSGGSLADKLKERLPSPLTEKEVVRYLSQVADALAYVHAHNKMHLDVKPGNIMLSDKDEAVLIDFGLVKQYDEEGEEICTTTLGGFSPRFSPLEQINCSGMLEQPDRSPFPFAHRGRMGIRCPGRKKQFGLPLCRRGRPAQGRHLQRECGRRNLSGEVENAQ